MKPEAAHQQTWSDKLDWFFTGYSVTDRERLWYLLKRLFWLGLWVTAVAMIVSLCTGKGVASLVLLIPIGVSVFISLFFRFD